MAKTFDDSELWFPGKENIKNGLTTEFDAGFGFPSEFPYEFDSFGLEPLIKSPPVESVEGSTETESSDEDDFFAGLTWRLRQATIHETRNQKLSVPINNSDKAEKERTRVLVGSPQSILSGIGSWSSRSGGSGDGSPDGGCSRVPSPFSAANDAWDVIYAAAGQVARLKMNGNADFQTRGVLGNLPHTTASFRNSNLPHFQYQQVSPEQVLNQHCGSIWRTEQIQAQNRGYENGMKSSRPLTHPAWPPLHSKHRSQNLERVGSGSRPVLHAGSGGVKRGCAGTGVFLPRQYGPPPEARKKTSCAPVVVPANFFHALNLNIDELNGTTNQPRFSSSLGADYDALLARRNALLMQQQRLALLRREEAASLSYEARLPQEWTY